MNYNTIIVILAIVVFVMVFYINEKTKKQNNKIIDNRIKNQLNTTQASQYMLKKAYTYETNRNPFNTTRKSGTTLEYKVFCTLFKYKGKVLSDLYVTNDKGDSTQLDTVLVYNTGVYVVECKDWKCREIYGSEDANNLKCVYDKGYEKSYGNPFRQNRYHIKYLSKY